MGIPGFPIGSSEHSAPQIQGNYSLEREASEPGPRIVDLNSELTECEGHLSTAVGERGHACDSLAILLDLRPHISFPSSRPASKGIGQPPEHLVVSEVKRVRLENTNGIKEMIGNILVLQQTIKTLKASRAIPGGTLRSRQEVLHAVLQAPDCMCPSRERVPTFVCSIDV